MRGSAFETETALLSRVRRGAARAHRSGIVTVARPIVEVASSIAATMAPSSSRFPGAAGLVPPRAVRSSILPRNRTCRRASSTAASGVPSTPSSPVSSWEGSSRTGKGRPCSSACRATASPETEGSGWTPKKRTPFGPYRSASLRISGAEAPETGQSPPITKSTTAVASLQSVGWWVRPCASFSANGSMVTGRVGSVTSRSFNAKPAISVARARGTRSASIRRRPASRPPPSPGAVPLSRPEPLTRPPGTLSRGERVIGWQSDQESSRESRCKWPLVYRSCRSVSITRHFAHRVTFAGPITLPSWRRVETVLRHSRGRVSSRVIRSRSPRRASNRGRRAGESTRLRVCEGSVARS